VITKFHYRRDGEGFRDLYQHIWTCEVRSGEVAQLTDGEWDDRDAVWSPDGKQIAFVSNRGDDPISKPYEEDIWLITQSGGELEKVPTPPGYKRNLTWSPDGEYIAYIGVETQDDPWVTRNERLWIAPLKSNSAPCCLTETLDRTVENATISDGRGAGNQNPVWSQDGKRISFLVSDRGNCHLYSVSLDGESKPLVAGDLDIAGFSIDAQGERFALLISSPDKPAEVYIASRDVMTHTLTINALSKLNGDWLGLLRLSVPEEIWFESFDGETVQGWFLKPPRFDPGKRYPLLLYIHGGPGAQYGNTFFHEFQVLAAQDIIVFYTNPRGSLGREDDFATSIRGNWGYLDFNDLLAAADYAESFPYVDSDRMAVAGGSYGGFMTTWMVGHTDRFRCAITERGVSNRHSAVGTSDFPPMPGGYWQGNAWDNPDKLWDQSPLRYAAKIHTPLLIIHSEGDLRCPIGQAEQLFSALKQLNKKVVFIRYPAETSHGFSRNGPPDLRIDRLGRIAAWLEKHLKHE
jgi:acylaminoacyl-peptidase